MKTSFTWNIPKINEIMNKRKMKRKDIAAKLKESPQLISYYLCSPPTMRKVIAIAAALSRKGDAVDWRDLII